MTDQSHAAESRCCANYDAYNGICTIHGNAATGKPPRESRAASKPGGPEPTFAEHPGFGIWPCDNPWHTTHKPHPEPVGKCPDCPNEWWASDGTECPEEYALLAEIRWLRERVAAADSRAVAPEAESTLKGTG